MAILRRGQKLENGRYTVQSLIKKTEYKETYRVENAEGTPFFLKLFIMKKVPNAMIDPRTKELYETENYIKLDSTMVPRFWGRNFMQTRVGRCVYYITDYFGDGVLLADELKRRGKLPEKEAERIFFNLCVALEQIHNSGFLHNDVTPRNIMVSKNEVKLIDMGHLSEFNQITFDQEDLDVLYSSNASFMGEYSVVSDFYSAIAVFYAMLMGRAPWEMDFPEGADFARKAFLLKLKRFVNPIDFEKIDLPQRMKTVLQEGLEFKSRNYDSLSSIFEHLMGDEYVDWKDYYCDSGLAVWDKHSVDDSAEPDDSADGNEKENDAFEALLQEFINADVEDNDDEENELSEADDFDQDSSDTKQEGRKTTSPQEDAPPARQWKEEDPQTYAEFHIKRGGGNGFKDVAGMEELKTYLSQRVIFVLQNKEKAERYRLTTPNGLLLYGPPGCGKTYMAEKFAEETGYNFILVKASDLGSSYVHGSQAKIAQLFEQAEKNAPVVICFDEFDALVPDRGGNVTSQSIDAEVNEFLTQLNNCGKKGIFVVGTTNRPDKIDPAILRTGRIDKLVYVPVPDKVARQEMFRLHLEGRPMADDIDTERLAEISEGFIASDIAYAVNDAAMVAAYTDKDIAEQLLEESLKNTHPSLRPDMVQFYEDIRAKMESRERKNNMGRPKIGFVQ